MPGVPAFAPGRRFGVTGLFIGLSRRSSRGERSRGRPRQSQRAHMKLVTWRIGSLVISIHQLTNSPSRQLHVTTEYPANGSFDRLTSRSVSACITLCYRDLFAGVAENEVMVKPHG